MSHFRLHLLNEKFTLPVLNKETLIVLMLLPSQCEGIFIKWPKNETRERSGRTEVPEYFFYLLTRLGDAGIHADTVVRTPSHPETGQLFESPMNDL